MRLSMIRLLIGLEDRICLANVLSLISVFVW
jgi:hypothetical protein